MNFKLWDTALTSYNFLRQKALSVSQVSEAELGALESFTKNKNLHIISSLIATALNKVGHYFN